MKHLSHRCFFRALTLLLLLTLILTPCLLACREETPPQEEADLLSVVADGASSYTIIRPMDASPEVVSAASALATSIESATGVRLAFTDDWVERNKEVPTDTPEILIGETNRAESAALLATLGDREYTIAIQNRRIVIIGKDDRSTLAAIDMFITDILGYSKHTDSYTHDSIRLACDLSLKGHLSANEEDTMIEQIRNTKHTLRFDENGEFRILVLSDTHFKEAPIAASNRNNIKTLVDREQPDLVIFNGDNTDAVSTPAALKEILSEMVAYIEECKIPWMHVYGNHDDTSLSRQAQQPVYESFAYCLSQWGERSLPGVGNYVLPVLASKSEDIVFAVWALDSFREMTDDEMDSIRPVTGAFPGMSESNGSHYGYIRTSQIQWYLNTSQALEEYAGKTVPGIMAFHIPLQENHTAYLNRKALDWDGAKNEAISAGELNSGLFAACLERGDIRMILNGHDHNNTYRYRYCGIDLCAVGTVSTAGYHANDLLGGRVIVVNEKKPEKPETYMSYLKP